MKKAKNWVLAAAALPLILTTASAYAFGGKHGGPGGFDADGFGGKGKGFAAKCAGYERGMLRELDLTAEQQEQLRALHDARRDERKAGRAEFMADHLAQMQAHQAKVQALVLADSFDQAQAEQLAAEMVQQQTERRVLQLKSQYEMLSILTAEQKNQLKQLQEERMQQCSDRMNQRMTKSAK